MNDDEVLSEVPSSPLSTALDTAVLDANSRATDGLNESFNSSSAEPAQYVKLGGKIYLAVDHTANRRKSCEPSWIWAHGEELRHLIGNKARKNWRCNLCGPPNRVIIPVESTTYRAGEHLRKKHRVYKPGTEPKARRPIGELAGQAFQSTCFIGAGSSLPVSSYSLDRVHARRSHGCRR
jgi:hypothetical protein